MDVQCTVLVVHLVLMSQDTKIQSPRQPFFSLVNLFAMDKECTTRVPKAQLHGAQPLVRSLKAQSYGTHPSLHNRAGTFASAIIK